MVVVTEDAAEIADEADLDETAAAVDSVAAEIEADLDETVAAIEIVVHVEMLHRVVLHETAAFPEVAQAHLRPSSENDNSRRAGVPPALIVPISYLMGTFCRRVGVPPANIV